MDISKTYRTRNGEAVILSTDIHTGEYPISGKYFYVDQNRWCAATWTAHGQARSDGVPHALDLVEVPSVELDSRRKPEYDCGMNLGELLSRAKPKPGHAEFESKQCSDDAESEAKCTDEADNAVSKEYEYETVAGLQVRIYATDGGGSLPVHGAVLDTTGWRKRAWTATGKCSKIRRSQPYSGDLVRVLPISYVNMFVHRDGKRDSFEYGSKEAATDAYKLLINRKNVIKGAVAVPVMWRSK